MSCQRVDVYRRETKRRVRNYTDISVLPVFVFPVSRFFTGVCIRSHRRRVDTHLRFSQLCHGFTLLARCARVFLIKNSNYTINENKFLTNFKIRPQL